MLSNVKSFWYNFVEQTWAYRRGSSLVVQREYSYDELGRPTARNTARQGAVVNDVFAHQ